MIVWRQFKPNELSVTFHRSDCCCSTSHKWVKDYIILKRQYLYQFHCQVFTKATFGQWFLFHFKIQFASRDGKEVFLRYVILHRMCIVFSPVILIHNQKSFIRVWYVWGASRQIAAKRWQLRELRIVIVPDRYAMQFETYVLTNDVQMWYRTRMKFCGAERNVMIYPEEKCFESNRRRLSSSTILQRIS